MAEREALEKCQDLFIMRCMKWMCVPLSLQFVLPEGLYVPPSIFEKAVKEDGLVPSEVLDILKEEGLVTYSSHSVTQEEANRYFSEHIKYMVNESAVFGIGFSTKLPHDNSHFVAVKKPLIQKNQIQVFDSMDKNPIHWVNIDNLISKSTLCANHGRHNIWFIYPGRKLKTEKIKI